MRKSRRAQSESALASPARHMRIGMFSESFHPVQNGVTTSLLTLTHGLRERKNHVFVFAPAHDQQPSSESNVLRFPSFVTLFNRDYPLAYPFLPRLKLASHFDSLRLDIVHTHTPFVLGLTGARMAIQRSVPLVSTFHTLYTRYSHYMPFLPESVTQMLIERYLPWYYNRCVEIICPSVVAENELRSLGVTQPIVVIPSGIPRPPAEAISCEARMAAREHFHLPSTAPLLLYAGRVAKEKRIDWLLEAFALVTAQSPNAHLAIAGTGPSVEELKNHAETLKISARVHFLGPQPRLLMDSLYAAADIFCFTSPTETQGLVIGEARAAGLPCVVMDSGGAPETVCHGVDGFRVPCGDTEAFCQAILSILNNPSQSVSMRDAARVNSLHFTPDAMVSRVLEVYQTAQKQPLPSDAAELTKIDSMDLTAVAEGLSDISSTG